jgi:hypothetical protein
MSKHHEVHHETPPLEPLAHYQIRTAVERIVRAAREATADMDPIVAKSVIDQAIESLQP